MAGQECGCVVNRLDNRMLFGNSVDLICSTHAGDMTGLAV
jgi:hypothetical protein